MNVALLKRLKEKERQVKLAKKVVAKVTTVTVTMSKPAPTFGGESKER